jgi:hypothetical protein
MKSNQLPAAMVLAGVLLLGGACGAGDDQGGSTSAPTAAKPQAELIEYDQEEPVGLSLAKPADVAKLKGAPDDFKQFIAGIIDASKTRPDEDCQFTVGVAKIDTSGFAAGSQHSCGGAAYIWAKRDGIWQEIWSGQDYPACDDMKKYSVPKPIAGNRCFQGQKEVEYTP